MGNFKGTQNSLGDFKVVGDFSQHIRRWGTEINFLVFGYYLIVSVKQLSGLRNRLRNSVIVPSCWMLISSWRVDKPNFSDNIVAPDRVILWDGGKIIQKRLLIPSIRFLWI